MKIEEYRSGVYQLLGDFPTVKELKKLKKMISIMIEEQNDYYDEIDAEYEMGRSCKPPGYDERRNM